MLVCCFQRPAQVYSRAVVLLQINFLISSAHFDITVICGLHNIYYKSKANYDHFFQFQNIQLFISKLYASKESEIYIVNVTCLLIVLPQ